MNTDFTVTQQEVTDLWRLLFAARDKEIRKEREKWRQRQLDWEEGKKTGEHVGFYTGAGNPHDCGCHGDYHDSCYS